MDSGTAVYRAAIITLDCAAVLITAGGLYDIFAPRLPANLVARCGQNEGACELVRWLLRALGGGLAAIGIAVGALVNGPIRRGQGWPLALVLILVLPSEGLNALGMRRVGSPYHFPLAFMVLTLAGVALAAAAAR